jgi:hypothetical protein
VVFHDHAIKNSLPCGLVGIFRHHVLHWSSCCRSSSPWSQPRAVFHQSIRTEG